MRTINFIQNEDLTAPLIVATPSSPPAYAPHVSSSNTAIPASDGGGEWTCPQCTLVNPNSADCCDACALARPQFKAPPPQAAMTLSLVPAASGRSVVVHQPPTTPVPVETYYEDPHMSNQTFLPYDDAPYDTEKVEIEEEEVIPGETALSKKRRRRRRRRWRMAGGATVGGVVGGVLFLGPWGIVAGGVAGGVTARVFSKRGERKMDARVAQSHLSAAVVD